MDCKNIQFYGVKFGVTFFYNWIFKTVLGMIKNSKDLSMKGLYAINKTSQIPFFRLLSEYEINPSIALLFLFDR